jgi:hypothetical protein
MEHLMEKLAAANTHSTARACSITGEDPSLVEVDLSNVDEVDLTNVEDDGTNVEDDGNYDGNEAEEDEEAQADVEEMYGDDMNKTKV